MYCCDWLASCWLAVNGKIPNVYTVAVIGLVPHVKLGLAKFLMYGSDWLVSLCTSIALIVSVPNV